VAELKATGICKPFRKEFFRKDGNPVPVMIGSATFERNSNEGVAFVVDLSDQKRAEEALQRSQTELTHVSRVITVGELTASIAHEVNQPLAAIVTNANAGLRWLAGDSPNLEETGEALRRVAREGNRASVIVARMRALFKKAPPTTERIDINEVIHEVLVLSQGEIQRNRISLHTKLANDLPFIIGDRIQLQQVILNLVLNSLQAMSGIAEGSRELEVSSETISSRHRGSQPQNYERSGSVNDQWTDVLISVKDSGPGFDPQFIDQLFEAFYTTKPQGLGMGLAISRSIIEAHRGRLWAKPNAQGGAVFQFTLPIRP